MCHPLKDRWCYPWLSLISSKLHPKDLRNWPQKGENTSQFCIDLLGELSIVHRNDGQDRDIIDLPALIPLPRHLSLDRLCKRPISLAVHAGALGFAYNCSSDYALQRSFRC